MSDPRREFANRLRELIDYADVTQSEVWRGVGSTRSTFSGWVNGQGVPDAETLSAILSFLIPRARSIAPPALLARDTWAELRQRANAAPRGGRREGNHSGIGVKGIHELGVKRAFSVAGSPDGWVTNYVLRAHDERVRAALAVPSGPRMVVVVGNSGTGKTRTCYEAVASTLPSWPVFVPAIRSPEGLSKLLKAGLPSRSIVWLDEIHVYLRGVADSAIELLLDVLNGPDSIAVVGTSWPEHWSQVARADDPERATAREGPAYSLANHHKTRVEASIPEGFTSPIDQAALRVAARSDPVLAEAIRLSGPDWAVTQTLGGGPRHVDQYGQLRLSTNPVDRAAWAILTAAVDAHRIGHTGPIERKLLQNGASAYLSASERVLPDDWFGLALQTAEKRLNGTRALTAERSAASGGTADRYVLHDYVDQHVARARWDQMPPGPVWEAVIEAVSADWNATLEVGAAALFRGLRIYSDQCLTIAMQHPVEDEVFAARLLATRWVEGDAEPRLVEMASNGEVYARWLLARRANDFHDEERLTELAALGDVYAFGLLVRRRAARGLPTSPDEFLDAAYGFAELVAAGREAADGDESHLERLVAAGTPYAAIFLAKRVSERDDDLRLEQLASGGSIYSEILLARRAADRNDDARLEQMAAAGNRAAMGALVKRATVKGDEPMLRRLRAAGNYNATVELIELLSERYPGVQNDGLNIEGTGPA